MKVVGFAGFSGSGKTTVLEQLIPEMVRRGHAVSVIKHAHHRFDIDQPGKDSYRHREAGAQEVLITSSHRWVLMHELRNEPEPGLEETLARLSNCDWVLVEGFKKHPLPKIEVWRAGLDLPFIHTDDAHVIALASDAPVPQCPLPQLDLNNVAHIADFLESTIQPWSA